MAQKSEAVAIADEMQKYWRSRLQELGFKSKGRTYNRLNTEGFTEVIGLQLGASDPPGTIYLPGLNQNMYGLFTVNLGVFIPEVHKFLNDWNLGSFIKEYNCCARIRLGAISRQTEDVWWRLARDENLFALILETIEVSALPFFERISTREKFLSQYQHQVGNTKEVAVPKIVCSMIYLEKGDKATAAKLLYQQARDTAIIPHREYVFELAKKLGLKLNQ
jgi:hypothetical protein